MFANVFICSVSVDDGVDCIRQDLMGFCLSTQNRTKKKKSLNFIFIQRSEIFQREKFINFRYKFPSLFALSWFSNARVGMASKWKVNRSQVTLLDYRSETTSFANSVFNPSFVTVIIRLLTAVMFLQSQVELLQDNRNVITLIASRDFQFHIRKTFPTDKRKLLNPQLGKCRWFIFQEHRHSYTSRPLATHNASSIVCMIYHDIRNELYSTRNEWPIL